MKILSVIPGLFLITSFVARGQAEYIPRVDIKEVVVTENRIQVPLSQKPAAIVIIGREQIKSAPAKSVPELLSYITGVDIRQRGQNGVQADAGIRGSSFDQVLILINGIRVSDPQTGHHSLNLPIDIEAIEQIEVYKGPSARVFGQNAFAGAINIVTKVPDDDFVGITAGGGDYGFLSGGVNLSLGGEGFRNYLALDHIRSGGYRYNTDFTVTNIFFQSALTTGAGEMGLLAGITDRSFGANGFYASPDYTDQYESVMTSLVALEYKPLTGDHRVKITTRLFNRTNDDEYIFIRSDPDYYRNLHTSNTTGFDFNLSLHSAAGITGVGLDLSNDRINSTRLGERSRFVGTLFAEHRFSLADDRLIITPGVQANLYSDFEDNILPGIDIGYHLSENIMVYSGTGYTFRVPTYTDLYYEDPVNSSNSRLQPEYSLSSEIGIKSTGRSRLAFSGSYFFRQGTNLIDRTRASEIDKWTPQNISEVITNGLELTAAYRPEKRSPVSMLLLERIEAGFTYIDARIGSVVPEFSRLELENLRNHLIAKVELRYFSLFSHSLLVRYADRVNMEDYSVVDSRLAYRKGDLTVYIEATNIFDTEYRETNLVPLAGRWFKAGASWKIRLK